MPTESGVASRTVLGTGASGSPAKDAPVDHSPGRQEGPPRHGQGSTGRAGGIVRPLVIYVASRVVTVATLAVMTVYTHTSISVEIDRWDSQWFLRAAAQGWPSHLPHTNGHVAGN